ncbi:MAG: hypothetical protein QNJ38_23780 [Prochloraceae cyanobacterium]|nr:hypothetical protein [Prochloraceae cyanobacterium]
MTQTTDNGWQQAILQNTRATAQLEVKVDILTNKVEQIEVSVDRLENKVEKIEQDVSEIKGQLQWLKWIAGGIVTIALALIARLIGDFLITH